MAGDLVSFGRGGGAKHRLLDQRRVGRGLPAQPWCDSWPKSRRGRSPRMWPSTMPARSVSCKNAGSNDQEKWWREGYRGTGDGTALKQGWYIPADNPRIRPRPQPRLPAQATEVRAAPRGEKRLARRGDASVTSTRTTHREPLSKRRVCIGPAMSTGSAPPPFSTATGAPAEASSSASLLSRPAPLPAHPRGLRPDRGRRFRLTYVCFHFPDGGGVSCGPATEPLPRLGRRPALGGEFYCTAALSGWAAVSYFGVPSDMRALPPSGSCSWSARSIFWAETQRQRLDVSRRAGGVDGAGYHRSEQRLPDHRISRAAACQRRRGLDPICRRHPRLSGVEAVAEYTGVIDLDPGSAPENPKVHAHGYESDHSGGDRGSARHRAPRTGRCSRCRKFSPGTDRPPGGHAPLSRRTLWLAHQSRPGSGRFLASSSAWFSASFCRAVNTAVVALIGVIYMMAQDGEMPKQLAKLNRHGVPRIPLFVAVVIPIVVLAVTRKFEALAGLYAIGVVGAIAVNLGSCTFNRKLALTWYRRLLMDASFSSWPGSKNPHREDETRRTLFAICVLGIGFALRAYSHKLSGLKTVTIKGEIGGNGRAGPSRDDAAEAEGKKRIMVAARGINTVLKHNLTFICWPAAEALNSLRVRQQFLPPVSWIWINQYLSMRARVRPALQRPHHHWCT